MTWRSIMDVWKFVKDLGLRRISHGNWIWRGWKSRCGGMRGCNSPGGRCQPIALWTPLYVERRWLYFLMDGRSIALHVKLYLSRTIPKKRVLFDSSTYYESTPRKRKEWREKEEWKRKDYGGEMAALTSVPTWFAFRLLQRQNDTIVHGQLIIW